MKALIAVSAALIAAAPSFARDQYPDVIYVPTPHEVVDDMLRLANVHKGDVLYDLGSGDGRIAIAAAKKYGIKAVGIDIDPERIREATENAKKAGVTNLVQFRQEDLFKADFRDATVVTLYLLPSLNLKLRPTLLRMKPGTRVVSHAFSMDDWRPDQTDNVEGRTAYLWIVPAAVAFQFSSRQRTLAAISWVAGTLASAGGLWLSFRYDLPTGPVIVCMFGVVLLAAYGLRRALGRVPEASLQPVPEQS